MTLTRLTWWYNLLWGTVKLESWVLVLFTRISCISFMNQSYIWYSNAMSLWMVLYLANCSRRSLFTLSSVWCLCEWLFLWLTVQDILVCSLAYHSWSCQTSHILRRCLCEWFCTKQLFFYFFLFTHISYMHPIKHLIF